MTMQYAHLAVVSFREDIAVFETKLESLTTLEPKNKIFWAPGGH
jgi:hypothetical protein